MVPFTPFTGLTVNADPEHTVEVMLLTCETARTFTYTWFVSEQPVAVSVSVKVYNVAAVGWAVGLDKLLADSPIDGLQEYVLPACEAAPIAPATPAQKSTSAPALSAGKGFTITGNGDVLITHPKLFITATS